MSTSQIATKNINKLRVFKKSSENQSYFIDKIFFVFIFLIAFMPRPTVDSPAALIAPIVISIFLFCSISYFFLNGVGIISTNSKLVLLFFIMFFIIILYTTRIIIRNEIQEYNYLLGRILSFLIIVVFLTWLNSRKIPLVEIYKTIFFSVIVVSLIVIYFGITGKGGFFIFSGMEHGREFSQGLSVPFYRSAGIERSYGEFGIFLAVSWAYFILFRKNHSLIVRSISGILLSLAIIISQSRTSWLAVLLVTTTFFIIKIGGKKLIIYFLLAMTFLLPLVTSLITTVGRELPVIKSIIGDRNIHEANVESRHSLDALAISLLFKKPLEMFIGISHAEWFKAFPRNFEKETGHGIAGLHNHFLANLLHLGIFSGLLYLLLFLIPVIRLINLENFHQDDIVLIILSTIGLISCLNFFEGFFSPISSVVLSTLMYAAYQPNPDKVFQRQGKPKFSDNSFSFPRQHKIS